MSRYTANLIRKGGKNQDLSQNIEVMTDGTIEIEVPLGNKNKKLICRDNVLKSEFETEAPKKCRCCAHGLCNAKSIKFAFPASEFQELLLQHHLENHVK